MRHLINTWKRPHISMTAVVSLAACLAGPISSAHAADWGRSGRFSPGLGRAGGAAGAAAQKRMGKYLKVGAVAAALAVPTIWGTSTHNRLVGEQEQVNMAWSHVDVELQRRSDLIPNLVSVAKGYAAYEQETFTKVAQARSALGSAQSTGEKVAAAQQLSIALTPLMTIQERYPALKANDQFMTVMSSLKEAESRIAVERQRYNDAAQAFNSDIRSFPTSAIAGMSSLQPAPYFKADSAARQAPVVDFSGK